MNTVLNLPQTVNKTALWTKFAPAQRKKKKKCFIGVILVGFGGLSLYVLTAEKIRVINDLRPHGLGREDDEGDVGDEGDA